MAENNLPQATNVGFEGLKKTNDYGAEYWSARDLQPLLGYTQWRQLRERHQESHNLLRAIG